MNTHFNIGDYIVLNNIERLSTSYIHNHIYRQDKDSDILQSIDSEGDKNGWSIYRAGDDYNWRYATSEEIKEYELRGEPYDISTLIIIKSNRKKDNRQLTKLLKELSKI